MCELLGLPQVQSDYWSGPPGSVFPPGQWSVMTVWLIQALKLKLRDQVSSTGTQCSRA
jgi:hypothetical protein